MTVMIVAIIIDSILCSILATSIDTYLMSVAAILAAGVMRYDRETHRR